MDVLKKIEIDFSQLWLDRVCLVNMGYNASICNNLSQYENITNQVQQQVTQYSIVGSYIENIPSIFITLYLGNLKYYI